MLIGGAAVSAFSFISDLLKPKTFAGLFAAAPSVALATLGMAFVMESRSYAITEARSMMAGAIAFIAYAYFLRMLLFRYKFSALAAALMTLPLWLVVAFGTWQAWLR
jgi:hypothetical protein